MNVCLYQGDCVRKQPHEFFMCLFSLTCVFEGEYAFNPVCMWVGVFPFVGEGTSQTSLQVAGQYGN